MANVETAKPKRVIQKAYQSQKNMLDKVDKPKIIRLGIWAVFLIVIGATAAFLLPEHSVESFFDLLKAIITTLIL